MKKKHVAILSTMYYPDMGAPSAVVDKYVQRLKENFEFHIITKTEVIDFVPSQIYDVRYITSFRHRLILKCRNQIKKKKNILINRIILIVINLCKFIQTQYSLPSAQKWEIRAYQDELEKLSKEFEIDTVIAVSNTWVTQIAALAFKRRYPNIKWIAFVLDPYWNFYIYYKYKLFKPIWRYLNYNMENTIYKRADYCMFTSEMFRYAPIEFNIDKSKVFEVKFPLTEFNIMPKSKYEDEICQLIFAGMFYKEIRNPEFTLLTLSKVKGIKFDMFVGVGECEDIIKRYEGNNIKREQFVTHELYLDMICNKYDILVNIGNVSTYQAPSKMLELLSTGKPIINFYFSKDSQYEMIEKYPLGLNIGYQEEDAVKKVEEFCYMMKGRIISFEQVELLFPENKLKFQVEMLKNVIDK